MAGAAIPVLSSAAAAAAPSVVTNSLLASLVGGAATGTAASVLPVAASTLAPSVVASVAPASGIFANANLSALTGTPAGSVFGSPNLAALSGTPGVAPYTGMGMAGAPPTFTQSIMSAGRNIQGLMRENPALTSVARQAGGAMMQPPPPPQVLQAPPIQSGQFAPVDFMSLLSQKPQQMQRRTSLLG